MQVVEQCGRGALARTLNAVLVLHIRASLPQLRVRLEEALEKCSAELRVYGDAPPGQTSAARCCLRGHVPALPHGTTLTPPALPCWHAHLHVGVNSRSGWHPRGRDCRPIKASLAGPFDRTQETIWPGIGMLQSP